ncbi:MarC family protein [Nitratidesulfovibrio sp. D1]|uniref:MarC family protein n=1 Tax=Nitratidesulfovibrio sp. D1 TaxID=3440151 RepID=UPI003EBA82AA
MSAIVNLFVTTLVKMFFLLTPFFVLTMFLTMTRDMTPQTQRRLAVRVGMAVYAVCMCLYFFGEYIFTLFGITLDAFRIGSGSLLFLSAVALVRDPQPSRVQEVTGDISVVPLAIPITVGPATIGALMVMGATVRGPLERVVASLGLLAAVLCVAVLLYIGPAIEKLLGRTGISILSKITGLILAALSAQIVFTGVRGFLN